MGNSAWGHGYHQGSTDGYRSGLGDGSAISAAVTLAAITLIAGAAWGYQKIKSNGIAKHEQSLLWDIEFADGLQDEVADEGTEAPEC